jgi:dehydrodolichyl diphosphate syntase complex subunit NUS1
LGVRRFLKNQLYVFTFAILHGFFSLYIRLRQFWNVVCYQVASIFYYHHSTPQYIKRDVMALKKIPKHLSVILKAEEDHRAKTDVERLIDETAEVAAWCACAEIPMLSVYEKTGKVITTSST